jgi:uncharacterized protein (DUF2141 family)
MPSALFILLLSISTGWASTDGKKQDAHGKDTGPDSSGGTLIVHVQGLKSSEGNLRFVLFDSEENYLKLPVRADIVAIENRKGVWVLENLPHGVYAVLVHHDIDESGVMERHWYGKPKEPTGTSNDAPAGFGPPKFKDAKFKFDSTNLTIAVTVK